MEQLNSAPRRVTSQTLARRFSYHFDPPPTHKFESRFVPDVLGT